jgi:sensor c-di-GMP phosphodiesterase-like protein
MTKGVFINYVTAVALIFGILIIFRGDYTNEKYLTYALSKAIKTKQLSVYYQPQIDRQGKSFQQKHYCVGNIPSEVL